MRGKGRGEKREKEEKRERQRGRKTRITSEIQELVLETVEEEKGNKRGKTPK